MGVKLELAHIGDGNLQEQVSEGGQCADGGGE